MFTITLFSSPYVAKKYDDGCLVVTTLLTSTLVSVLDVGSFITKESLRLGKYHGMLTKNDETVIIMGFDAVWSHD